MMSAHSLSVWRSIHYSVNQQYALSSVTHSKQLQFPHRIDLLLAALVCEVSSSFDVYLIQYSDIYLNQDTSKSTIEVCLYVCVTDVSVVNVGRQFRGVAENVD